MGHAQFNPNNTEAMWVPTNRPEGGGNISQYITKPREVPIRLMMKRLKWAGSAKHMATRVCES